MRRQIAWIMAGFLLCTTLFLTNGLLCCAQEVSGTYTEQNPDTGYQIVIEDDADLLTEEQEMDLAAVMLDITAYGNVAFKTITSNSTSAENYAMNYYEKLFDTDSGTLFLIDMDNRMLRIHSDGAVYRIITKAYADTITDNVYRDASAGDYYRCASEAFREIFALLKGNRIAQPMKYISNALLAMILALLINFGVVIYFTKVRKPNENEILKRAEIYFTCTEPQAEFIHQTKVYDPVSNDSGGSGGSRSSGGSSGGSRSSGGGGGHRF